MAILGIFGPIGVNDIGDWALLMESITLIDDILNKDVIYNVFTFDTVLSEEQLKGFEPKENGRIRLIKNPGKDGIYLTSTQIQKNTEEMIDNVKRIRNGFLFEAWGRDFIRAFDESNALFFIGGGYLNGYWGKALYTSYIYPLQRAYYLRKKVMISGVTVGPFLEDETPKMYGMFDACDLIITRDIGYSKNILANMGFDLSRIIQGCDDALIPFQSNISGEFMESFGISPNDNYCILTLSPWVYRFIDNKRDLLETLAVFCDYIIKNDHTKIVYLPFNYNRDVDFLVGNEVKNKLNLRNDFTVIEPIDDYLKLRYIVRYAKFVLSNRYHPVVFATGENVPFMGLVVNDLYQAKLQAACEVVELPVDRHLLSIDKVNYDDLVQKYNQLKSCALSSKQIGKKLNERRIDTIKNWLRQIK